MKSQVRKHGEGYVSGKYKYTHLGVNSESEGVPPVPVTSLQFSYFSYDYYDVIHLLQIPIIIINNTRTYIHSSSSTLYFKCDRINVSCLHVWVRFVLF